MTGVMMTCAIASFTVLIIATRSIRNRLSVEEAERSVSGNDGDLLTVIYKTLRKEEVQQRGSGGIVNLTFAKRSFAFRFCRRLPLHLVVEEGILMST
jgi:hypothetical protein